MRRASARDESSIHLRRRSGKREQQVLDGISIMEIRSRALGSFEIVVAPPPSTPGPPPHRGALAALRMRYRPLTASSTMPVFSDSNR